MASQDYFDTAQICRNGHVITINYNHNPDERKKHCTQCGADTLNECPYCHSAIQGCKRCSYDKPSSGNYLTGEWNYEKVDVSITELPEYLPPAYCHECGKPYPWTEESLNEIHRLIEMMDNLSDEQKAKLSSLFPDLIVETPHTVSSAISAASILKSVDSMLQDAIKASIGDKLVSSAIHFFGW